MQATKSITKADVCYLDMFCGPGLDHDTEADEIIHGSPLIGLELYPKLRRFVFVDWDGANTAQIDRFIKERGLQNKSHVLTGDCNSVVDEALSHIPTDGATFCFLDPAQANLDWSTVEKIAAHKPGRKIEQLILFPYDIALVRLLPRDTTSDFMWKLDSEGRVDAVMPETTHWRNVIRFRNGGAIAATEARRRFAYIYWKGLKNLGYKYVLSPKLLRRPDGHPLYCLFFASDHPAGERIMKHVFSKSRETDPSPGQLQMEMDLGLDVLAPIFDDSWDFNDGEDWFDNPEPPAPFH